MTGDENSVSEEIARLRARVDDVEKLLIPVAAMGFAAGLEFGTSKRRLSVAFCDDIIAKLLVDRASTTDPVRQMEADVGVALIEMVRAEALAELRRSTQGATS